MFKEYSREEGAMDEGLEECGTRNDSGVRASVAQVRDLEVHKRNLMRLLLEEHLAYCHKSIR